MNLTKEELIKQRNKIIDSWWRPFLYGKKLKKIDAQIDKMDLDEFLNSDYKKKTDEILEKAIKIEYDLTYRLLKLQGFPFSRSQKKFSDLQASDGIEFYLGKDRSK